MKALLVHADGTTETLDTDEAFGQYIIRPELCPHCKSPVGPDRKYVGHFASNHKTVGAEVTDKHIALRRDCRDLNRGTIVFVEMPS